MIPGARSFSVDDKSARSSGTSERRLPSFFSWLSGLVLCLFFLLTLLVTFKNYYSAVLCFQGFHLLETPSFRQAGPPLIRAVSLNPQDGYSHFYLAVFLKEIGRNEESLEELNRALKSTGHPASTLKIMAELHLARGEGSLASDLYDLALDYDPHPRNAPSFCWFNAGRAALRSGRNATALFSLRRALSFPEVPVNVGPLTGLSMAFMSNAPAALSEYMRILSLLPASRKDLPQWILALRRSGREDFAVDLLQSMDKKAPLDVRELCLMSSLLLKQNRLGEAEACLDRAQGLDPSEADIFLLRAEIASSRKDPEAMKAAYRQFLKIRPDSPRRAWIQKRLSEGEGE